MGAEMGEPGPDKLLKTLDFPVDFGYFAGAGRAPVGSRC